MIWCRNYPKDYTMTDRELLEAAAKAAGIDLRYWSESQELFNLALTEPRRWWNPLADDGDALRLAVRLRIDLLMDGHEVDAPCIEAISSTDADCRPFAIEALDTGNPLAATRRAIVRAAAALGSK